VWVRARLCKLQKGCTRLATASNKVYQLLAHGRWFSTDTPASSTTKTGRHDIAEILLKVALKHQKSINQSLFSQYCKPYLLVSCILVMSGDSTITSLLPVKQRCFIIFLLWAGPDVVVEAII
jgi:hypothetical protein